MADSGIVAVFGSMNMDLSVACERMPRAGETVGGSGFITNAGGKGATRPWQLRAWGARTCMIGAVGRDAFWRCAGGGTSRMPAWALSSWRGATTWRRARRPSSGCESDNRIVLSPGANHALTGDDVACALRYLVADELDRDACGLAPAAGSVFIAQGECDLAATAEALVCAHELGFYDGL